MNFPSTEFDDTLSAYLHGIASATGAEQLQLVLKSSAAARDEFLWHVELHATLAAMATAPSAIDHVAERLSSVGRARRPATKEMPVAWLVTTGIVAVVMAVAVLWAIRKSGEPDRSAAVAPSSPDAEQNSTDSGGAAGIYRATVAFVAAADAPIIVGTGQLEPIELGAQIPYANGGTTLHIWDYSQSRQSRVMKDTRLWPDQHFTVSPDGRWFVWANGTVLDLSNGDRTKIDLGGEFYFDNAGGKLERIQGLRFTPDGRRLALLVSNLALTPSHHPLRKQDFTATHSVQLVEFPEARFVSEFQSSFPVAFSDDGQHVVSASPEGEVQQQILERTTATGEVVRKYEPLVQGFAYTMSWSPDRSQIAVFDGVGEVLVWNTVTGELAYRVNVRQATNSSASLRFSPDGKHLAIGIFLKTVVVNAATGAEEASIPTRSFAEHLRWSPDGGTLFVLNNVTAHGIAEGQDKDGRQTVHNMYPNFERFDFDAVRK